MKRISSYSSMLSGGTGETPLSFWQLSSCQIYCVKIQNAKRNESIRWSTIARSLPGRTDNEIKNYWRTHFKKERIPSNCFKKSKMQPPRAHQYPQAEQQFLPQEDQFLERLIMFILNQGDNGVPLNEKEDEQQYLASSLSHGNSFLPEMLNESVTWSLDEPYVNIHDPQEAGLSPEFYSQANFTWSS